MSTPLSPESKKKILEAYKKFRASIKKITKDHRVTVTKIIDKLEQRHAQKLLKKLNG